MQNAPNRLEFASCARNSASCGQKLRKSVFLGVPPARLRAASATRSASTWGFLQSPSWQHRILAEKACKNTDFRNFCPREVGKVASELRQPPDQLRLASPAAPTRYNGRDRQALLSSARRDSHALRLVRHGRTSRKCARGSLSYARAAGCRKPGRECPLPR